jgi:hypothetical protein
MHGERRFGKNLSKSHVTKVCRCFIIIITPPTIWGSCCSSLSCGRKKKCAIWRDCDALASIVRDQVRKNDFVDCLFVSTTDETDDDNTTIWRSCVARACVGDELRWRPRPSRYMLSTIEFMTKNAKREHMSNYQRRNWPTCS